METEITLSPKALEALQTIYPRVEPPSSAERLWQRVLSPHDREQLGGDIKRAYCEYGTIGMWMRVRGVSGERALIEVANRLGFLSGNDQEWLLREVGEISDDPEKAIEKAVASGGLVILERPRMVYWNGDQIPIDWDTHSKSWSYFYELCRQAKSGQSIDRLTFGDEIHKDFLVKQKSRLTNLDGFPLSLSDLIETVGHGTQRLNLPPAQIRLFEITTMEMLRERTA